MDLTQCVIDDYGIILGFKEFYFIRRIEYNPTEEHRCICMKMGAKYVRGFIGRINVIDKDGNEHSGRECTYKDKMMLFLPINVFNTIFSTVFSNMDELVTEMKSKYGNYLPDDFDYAKRIRHIVGTYCG